VEDSTQVGYKQLIEDWYTFCDIFGRDPLLASPRAVQEYVWYLYQYTTKPAGPAKRRVTALGYYWKCHGIDWDRKLYPTITCMLKGYTKRRPSEVKRRNPWTFWHIVKALPWINLNTYTGCLQMAGICIGYHFGGRIGEYAAYTRKDWDYLVRRCDIEMIYDNDKLVMMTVDFRHHKTNKEGIYSGKVDSCCECENGLCGIHLIERFIKLRDREWTDAHNFPLLVQLSGKPMRAIHMNNLLKFLARNMGIDPTFYSSHSLRAGRATDLARAQTPTWLIKKWGRWRSDCWQDLYAKLDCSDIAKITKRSLVSLGLSGNAINIEELEQFRPNFN